MPTQMASVFAARHHHAGDPRNQTLLRQLFGKDVPTGPQIRGARLLARSRAPNTVRSTGPYDPVGHALSSSRQAFVQYLAGQSSPAVRANASRYARNASGALKRVRGRRGSPGGPDRTLDSAFGPVGEGSAGAALGPSPEERPDEDGEDFYDADMDIDFPPPETEEDTGMDIDVKAEKKEEDAKPVGSNPYGGPPPPPPAPHRVSLGTQTLLPATSDAATQLELPLLRHLHTQTDFPRGPLLKTRHVQTEPPSTRRFGTQAGPGLIFKSEAVATVKREEPEPNALAFAPRAPPLEHLPFVKLEPRRSIKTENPLYTPITWIDAAAPSNPVVAPRYIKAETPVKQEEPLLPIKQEPPVRIKQEDLVPVKQERPVPIKRETTVPVKHEDLVPIKEEKPVRIKSEVPIKEEKPVRIKSEVPIKEEKPVRIKRERTVPVKEEDLVPIKQERLVPVKKEKLVPIKIEDEEEDLVPIKKEEEADLVPIKKEKLKRHLDEIKVESGTALPVVTRFQWRPPSPPSSRAAVVGRSQAPAWPPSTSAPLHTALGRRPVEVIDLDPEPSLPPTPFRPKHPIENRPLSTVAQRFEAPNLSLSDLMQKRPLHLTEGEWVRSPRVALSRREKNRLAHFARAERNQEISAFNPHKRVRRDHKGKGPA